MEHVCDEGCEKECVLITEAEKSTIEVEVNGAWGMFVILQCVVVFIIWVAGTIMSRNATAGLDSFFPEMTHLREQQGQVWRWWTYQFTHGSAKHVVFNCVLLLFATPMERSHGTLSAWFFFNAGVLGGAWSHMLTDVHRDVVGMSGGSCGLVGAWVAGLLLLPCRYQRYQCVALTQMVVAMFVEWAVSQEEVAIRSPVGGMVGGVVGYIVVEVIARRVPGPGF